MQLKRRDILATGLALTVPATARAATRISLLYTAIAPYAGAYVAKDQGIFARHGLEVDLLLAANGSVIIASLAAGSAQIGTPTPSVFVMAAANGISVVALADTNDFPETARSGLVARVGVDIREPADLVGKRVGVPGIGGLLDIVLRKWMLDSHVDPAGTMFVETAFSQQPDALRGKQVDAVVSVDPFLTRAIQMGVGSYAGDYTKALPDGTCASVYAATSDWIAANPAAVTAFQAAISEATAFALTHPAETRDSIARYTHLPSEVVARMPIPNLATRITPPQIAFWIKVCRDQNLLSGSLDPAKLIAPWTA